MKRKMRALAMLLALALILSLSGMTASADTDGEVITDPNSTAAQAWQNFADNDNNYSGLNLGSQQFFIADFKSSLPSASSITGIQFSADHTINGYIGNYLHFADWPAIWSPVITGYDNNSPLGETKISLSGTSPSSIKPDTQTLNSSSELCIGFALEGTIEQDTTVTISTMSGSEAIESHSYTFKANASSTEPTVTPTPAPAPTSIKLHRLLANNEDGGECTAFTLYVGKGQYDAQPGILHLDPVLSPEGANQNVTWKIKDHNLNNGQEFTIAEYKAYVAEHLEDYQSVVSADGSIYMADILALHPGIVTLTAISDADPAVKASCEITITNVVHVQTGNDTDSFSTLLDAVADSDTTTDTNFTVNSETTIAGIKVPASSTVTVKDVEEQSKDGTGAVTAKEVDIISDSTTNTVYVVTDGNNSVAIKSNSVTVDSDTITGENKPVTSYIDVTKTLAKAVAAMTAPINKITGVELSLKLTDAAVSAPHAVTENVESPAFVCEVHPEATVTYIVDGNPTGKAVYTVPNEDLAAGTSFNVALTDLDDSKTYTIYHYASDGTEKGTFPNRIPSGGKITLQLDSFSYLVGVANDTSTPEIVNNKVNSVYRTYMNLQTNLFLNYQLYLTGDTSSTDYAQNGKLVLSYDGNSYEIDLNSVGAYSESAMRIGVATNGFYCGRHYVEGSPSSWYYVSFGVFPNKMDAACTVKVLKADDSETPLYLNTNTGATGISSAVLQSLVNNTYSTTVNSFENSLLARYDAGTADYTLAQQVKAYGAAAAAVFN